jgi:hypothetical protein
MKFPQTFPVKVVGLNTPDFVTTVKTILEKHVTSEITYTEQPSSGGKYLSLTATFLAEGKDQLDAVYRELHGNKLVLMTL